MKISFLLAAFVGAAATPLLAQTDRGYVAASDGFAVTTDTTSGNALGEVGVRVAPHLESASRA